ncbi:CHAT domain-containing protein [Desmonostoc muscorum LEGE 12446]|uniref:CHAT domain-containing protein n=1 Tax=Desmonostoc muscorum LEGE 12446 TaxID=1828758 RepID=A0A8J7CZY4_DESMC|nr:CHAT domain-containing protein [Desmonostoc muscorum]MCF2148197.1 CHAT domain-containing protein [Desmonostoc muscorum LEGE 12446]
MTSSHIPVKTILILAANPIGTSQLRLDEEIREVEAALQLSSNRHRFHLCCKVAVRLEDVFQAILRYRPQIVHFCSHGTADGNLILEDKNGKIQLVDAEALANFLKIFKDFLECVILNACHSEIQAKAISKHIDFAIGMNGAVTDQAAITFIRAFYCGLGAGESYKFAYKLGCAALQLERMPLTPVLKKRVMKLTDEQLQTMIANICENSNPANINRLLIQLQQLPGLLRSSHPLYLEALDKTWEWVIKNICDFEPPPHLTIKEGLKTWINGYLCWRIRDLYLPNNSHPQISIYQPFNSDSEDGKTLLDEISETGYQTPTLNGLDAFVKRLEHQKIQRIFAEFEDYIQQDPQEKLRSCHPRKFPDCNCQVLSKRLLLQDPAQRYSRISRDLGINEQTLKSHWTRICKPLLQEILENLGYSGNEEL